MEVQFTAEQLYIIRLEFADRIAEARTKLQEVTSKDLRRFIQGAINTYCGMVNKCNDALDGIYDKVDINKL